MTRQHIRTGLIAAVFLAALIWISPSQLSVEAISFSLTQVTSTSAIRELDLDMQGDLLAWRGESAAGNQIFIHNLASGDTRSISDVGLVHHPITDGSYVAWLRFDGVNQRLELWDGWTVIPLAVSAVGRFDMDQGKIAYSDPNTNGIILRDIATGSSERLADAIRSSGVNQIVDDYILFGGKATTGPLGGLSGMWLYQISTGEIRSIFVNQGLVVNQNTALTDIYVVWSQYISSPIPESAIFLYDIAANSTTRLTDYEYRDTAQIYIDDDHFIWNGGRDLFVYEISTGLLRQVASSVDRSTARVGQGRVAFAQNFFGNFSPVTIYDVSQDDFTRIETPDFDLPGGLRIYKDRVAWIGINKGDPSKHEIFLARLGNTPSGTNVVVEPLQGVSVIFSEVDRSGDTTVTINSMGPPPPTAFRLGTPPIFYDINTTASYAGSIEVCIQYDAASFSGPEQNLRLLYKPNGDWVDVTSSHDLDADTICGIVDTISLFAIAEEISLEGLRQLIVETVNQPGIQQSLIVKVDAALRARDRDDSRVVARGLHAFIREVNALSPRHINSETADLLKESAEALIEIHGEF